MSKISIAVCTLNQLALDFRGNCHRIIESIKEAVKFGACLRVGPELEVSGYSCEDAFFEVDTVHHSWQVLGEIIKADFKDVIIDIGMPVLKDSSLYNCRVVLLNSMIVFIRPKMKLANGGNYREARWFTTWGDGDTHESRVDWFRLPKMISEINGQSFVPFGADVVLEVPLAHDGFGFTPPLRIGFEICEELWSVSSTHVKLLGERGCHIICNSSGSYWEIRKLDRVMKLIQSATSKAGGIYVYSNLVGCDGGRLCFSGRSVAVMNGDLLAMTTSKKDLFKEVQVAVVSVDVLDVVSYRRQTGFKARTHCNVGSRLLFDPKSGAMEGINTSCETLTIAMKNWSAKPSRTPVPTTDTSLLNLTPEEEIQTYASLWLWDYLRRSSMKGFIVPLSGGLDSCSVACIVYCMCVLAWEQRQQAAVQAALKHLVGTSSLDEPRTLCKNILKCCFLSTRYSSEDSLSRAKAVAELIGATFAAFNFDSIYEDIQGKATPSRQKAAPVTLLQQNLQARLRMILTYYFSEGNRLVLATGNVDEALVGYLTKYDCSSADLNPIGSISKADLKKFLIYFKTNFAKENPQAIERVVNAIPSAELSGQEQKDEDDIGLTYDELSIFGRLRRGDLGCFGPYSMFCKLWQERSTLFEGVSTPEVLAHKVKRFFTLHARNRHKQTVLTPSLHAVTYSPDDNRFDHRQFLFDTKWTWQFECIDREVAIIKQGS